MNLFKLPGIRNRLKRYLFVLKIGVLTGMIIVLFELINLFVVYQHVRLDYYLSLVAMVFFSTGLLINQKRKRPEIPEQIYGNSLTPREVEILHMIAEGKTNKEIASAYFIELSTVKTHINNIYSKLCLSNRREARSKYEEMIKKDRII